MTHLFPEESRHIIDLTHPISAKAPTWNGSCGFHLKMICSYPEAPLRVNKIETIAGIGTHIDAPSHFIPGGIDIDQISLSNLIIPGVVIDISDKATATYMLSIEDIQNFESKHGTIAENSLVIVYTGWSRFWNQPAKYRNENASGVMEFPTISTEAARYLLKRNIAGIAIDTLSPDSASSDFPVHQLILGAGKYIIENVAHAESLPPSGFKVIVLPMKIEQATEAPVRMIALLPFIL